MVLSQVKPKPKRVRANRMPLGDLTPRIAHAKVLAKACELRDAMAECTLTDEAIALVAMKVNTAASTAKIARGLGIDERRAHVMLARPQAQQLMSEMAHTLLGGAAIQATHTMMRIMGSRDHALAYRAAEHMMERAGLGISQRTTPDGSTKTVFAFAFGAPQASTTPPHNVALPISHAQMGPIDTASPSDGPSKTQGLAVGEGDPRAILEAGAGGRGDSPVILEPTPEVAGLRLRGVKRRSSRSTTDR